MKEAEHQTQAGEPQAMPAPTEAKASYRQDQEWTVAPIRCIALANSANDTGTGNILALTADQPKEK